MTFVIWDGARSSSYNAGPTALSSGDSCSDAQPGEGEGSVDIHAQHYAIGDQGPTEGNYYFEYNVNYGVSVSGSSAPYQTGLAINLGLIASASFPGDPIKGYNFQVNVADGSYLSTSANLTSGVAATRIGTGASGSGIISVAYSLLSGKMWIAVNGAWEGGGDPEVGTGENMTLLAGQRFSCASANSAFRGAAGISGSASSNINANFGGGSFTYGPPRGFGAILGSSAQILRKPTLGFRGNVGVETNRRYYSWMKDRRT